MGIESRVWENKCVDGFSTYCFDGCCFPFNHSTSLLVIHIGNLLFLHTVQRLGGSFKLALAIRMFLVVDFPLLLFKFEWMVDCDFIFDFFGWKRGHLTVERVKGETNYSISFREDSFKPPLKWFKCGYYCLR